MAEERVLVLLPAYNQESTIAQSIEAVIKQSHRNWILICQDDCSTDRTLEIIESYASADSRIHSFALTKNVGLSGNWNSLAEKSLNNFESSYVCWLAGDDYWAESTYLEHLIKAQVNNGIEISSPSFQKVSLTNKKIDPPFLVKLNLNSKFLRTTSLLNWKLGGLYILYSLYSRNHFERVLYQGGAPSKYPGSDFWWVYAAILNYKVINVPSATFCKGVIEYDKHNLNPHREVEMNKLSKKNKLKAILWGWKLQASLFKHLIFNERNRFSYLRNWTLPLICFGIFLVTIFNTIRFPIDGIRNRLKNFQNKLKQWK
jgi:glycosyltransferase involved in cell wall biosynthesis